MAERPHKFRGSDEQWGLAQTRLSRRNPKARPPRGRDFPAHYNGAARRGRGLSFAGRIFRTAMPRSTRGAATADGRHGVARVHRRSWARRKPGCYSGERTHREGPGIFLDLRAWAIHDRDTIRLADTAGACARCATRRWPIRRWRAVPVVCSAARGPMSLLAWRTRSSSGGLAPNNTVAGGFAPPLRASPACRPSGRSPVRKEAEGALVTDGPTRMVPSIGKSLRS